MRKKERQLITLGLVLLFAVIAYWAYSSDSFGFIDLSGWLHGNETTEGGGDTYELGVINLTSEVLEVGDLKISFELANEDQFNISDVKVYYALNVADPSNASYTAVTATKAESTAHSEIRFTTTSRFNTSRMIQHLSSDTQAADTRALL